MPPLGTWPATQACALTGNQTSDLCLFRRPVPNPLSHTSQRLCYYFLNFFPHILLYSTICCLFLVDIGFLRSAFTSRFLHFSLILSFLFFLLHFLRYLHFLFPYPLFCFPLVPCLSFLLHISNFMFFFNSYINV